MEKEINQPSPESIMQVGTGFWASKILLAAVKFQLFTLLAAEKKMSARQIKTSLNLGCTDRNVYDFLDTLTAFKFLNREGILGECHVFELCSYRCYFLTRNKPSYIGGLLEMLNNRLYQHWGNLEEGLLTGLPQNEAKDGNGNLFEAIYQSPEKLREFINAMSGIQKGNFSAFAQEIRFFKLQYTYRCRRRKCLTFINGGQASATYVMYKF